MSDENDPAGDEAPATENSWLILRDAVNSVMADIVQRVEPENRDKVVELRDATGRYMASEYLRLHPDPRQLLVEMIVAGAIRVNFGE